MSAITQVFGGAGQARFEFPGDFFRLIDGVNPVDVIFYKRGSEIARAEQMLPGYGETVNDAFDAFVIVSGTAQTVRCVVRKGGEVRYDRASGSVTVLNVNGAFVNTQKTVTNASAQLLAANAARRYLLIQNNDAAGNIFVRLDGGVATVGTGVKIPFGGSYEIGVGGYTPTGAIVAIGDIASNANIVTVEG